ncbi:response regulator containing a CheY-like receiver domain and an HTH DNA-binding domain [Herbaspirillum sp. CF444]|nr:response regulator containing a CheY-like receiver domain and an HTH DNA-binding domain [Herbaspirillum sp. CF444]
MSCLNISFIAANDVTSICQDFFRRSGINCFSYSRVYKDGSRSELWSDARALNHTFFEKKYIVGSYTPDYYGHKERYAILEHKVCSFTTETRNRYIAQINDQRNLFDHAFPFKIINFTDEYCEYFLFYSSVSNVNAVGFYLNNLDMLESFVAFFKVAASKLIAQADKERLISGTRPHSGMPGTPVSTKNVHLGSLTNECELTPRQTQIAQYVIAGKTAREIATLLIVSPRTIETHIDNMKSRLGCMNKTELILRLSNTHKRSDCDRPRTTQAKTLDNL